MLGDAARREALAKVCFDSARLHAEALRAVLGAPGCTGAGGVLPHPAGHALLLRDADGHAPLRCGRAARRAQALGQFRAYH